MLSLRAPYVLALAGLAGAQSLCDALLKRNSTGFCESLDQDSSLSDFRNHTSNVTVLAWSDTATGRYTDDFVAQMKYHFVKGVYSSQYISNHTGNATSRVEYILLETYLDDRSVVNITGSQKIGGSDWDNGLKFWAGKTYANAVTMDIPFDGGIIHIIDSILQIPGPITETLPQAGAITTDGGATAVMVEALYLTGLMHDVLAAEDLMLLAPSDAAFHEIGSVFDGMSLDKLKEIIGYHIIVGNVTYADAIPPNSPTWSSDTKTMSSKTLNLTHTGGDPSITRQGLLFNQVGSDYTDIFISNGNILLLSKVLDPDHTTETEETYPDAKRGGIPDGQPLFTNIVGNNATSAPSPSATSGGLDNSEAPGSQSGSLSPGAKAGIGVGVSIGGLALIGLGVWIFSRRRRSRTPVHGTAPAQDERDEKDRMELDAQGTQVRPELGG